MTPVVVLVPWHLARAQYQHLGWHHGRSPMFVWI